MWDVSLLAQGKFEIVNMDMKMGSSLKIKGKITDGVSPGEGRWGRTGRGPATELALSGKVGAGKAAL